MPLNDDSENCDLGLHSHYRFEIEKCAKRIIEKGAKRVALQFPEGLLMFATAVADILEAKTGAEMIILGDVTYGACCVDDYSANALGCDFLIHYGHSCLISIKDCLIKNIMYVFLEIDIDVEHFVDTVKKLIDPKKKVACIGTVQFISSMRAGVLKLKDHFVNPIVIPQIKPLSRGEVLGCTSPLLDSNEIDTVLYLADGRFHLESFLIRNPTIEAFQYDPYKKIMTAETYDIGRMLGMRKEAIDEAKGASSFALIMGTLGRQGNPRVVNRLISLAAKANKTVTLFLMSEISPQKAALIRDVDCFIQVACPRLSIDWGYAFDRPLLSPYDAEVALGNEEWTGQYPMDHYAKTGGNWRVYAEE